MSQPTETKPVCPPHRWFIEVDYGPEGHKETWTCQQCDEKKVIVRDRTDQPKPAWTVGKATPRPRKEEEEAPHEEA